jgi:NAD(P)-dependent dehydrogenase (short-subunit alcohol dehydrogenase family)
MVATQVPDRAKVVGCDTDLDAGPATAAAVRAAGGEMTFVEADVADDAAVKELVTIAVRTYGGLDCAVNNAGTEATGLIADSERDSRDAGAGRRLDRQHVLGHQ